MPSNNFAALQLSRYLALAAGVLAGSAYSLADTCKAPTEQKQSEVSAYILKRYHFDANAETVLVDSSQANDSCYWKFHFRVSSPKSEVTLFLSPDGEYVIPTLYDLRVDPRAEERAKAEKLAHALVAGGPPTLGAQNAPITIVEFSDFQCPFCKRMTDVIEKDLTDDDRKDLKIVFRQFPLPIHPWAKGAAEAAGCAALESDTAFWKVHDYLFQNQAAFTADNVRDKVASFAAENAGVNKSQFQACLDKKLSTGGVEQDMELGKTNSVKATPTLFINGTRYEGMKDAAALRAIIADIKKAPQPEQKDIAAK